MLQMEDKMSDISATPSATIPSVVTQLAAIEIEGTLNRKRQKLQSDSDANLPSLPTDMSFTFPD